MCDAATTTGHMLPRMFTTECFGAQQKEWTLPSPTKSQGISCQQPFQIRRDGHVGTFPRASNLNEFVIVLTERYSRLSQTMLSANSTASHTALKTIDNCIMP